jgi:hypothetical protein
MNFKGNRLLLRDWNAPQGYFLPGNVLISSPANDFGGLLLAAKATIFFLNKNNQPQYSTAG